MKRLIALLTILAMVLSFTPALAADAQTIQSFIQASTNPYERVNVKVTAGYWAGGSFFDAMPQLGQLRDIINGMSVTEEANLVMNSEMTKYQGNVVANYTLPESFKQLIGDFPTGAEAWVDVDLTNAENAKLLMIMNILGSFEQMPAEYANKYLVFDLGTNKEVLDEMATLYKQLLEMLPVIYDEIMPKLLKDVDFNLTFDGSTYKMSMNEAQIKAMIGQLLKNLVAIVAEYAPEEAGDVNEVYARIDEVMAIINSIKLFSDDTLFSVSLTVDGANRPTYMNAKMYLGANLYDIAAAIDPQSVAGAAAMRDSMWLQLSAEANAYFTELPADYQVAFPALTVENSVNVVGEFTPDPVFDRSTPITVKYNGTDIVFDEQPMLVNDRTMVPIRALANAIGITNDNIAYDEATEKITLKSDAVELIMYVDSDVVTLNGDEITIDVPVVEANGRAYIPARYVSEFFNKNVGYTDLAETGGVGLIVTITD